MWLLQDAAALWNLAAWRTSRRRRDRSDDKLSQSAPTHGKGNAVYVYSLPLCMESTVQWTPETGESTKDYAHWKFPLHVDLEKKLADKGGSVRD